MRIFSVPNWGDGSSGQREAITPAGCWYGVAIGPESDEGYVYVDGALLQGGRVLPLRKNNGSYKIARHRIDPSGAFPESILRLDLMLFEHPSELAVEVARPTKMYTASWADPGAATEIQAIVFPFSGRRHASIQVHSSSFTNYRIVGRTFDGTSAEIADTAGAFGGVADEGTEVIHVGGTDHAEQFEEVQLFITTAEVGSVIVMVSGELGCR